MSDRLRTYLSRPENSRTREALLRQRFFYDVTLAAAEIGYALELYEAVVDQHGFDAVLADGSTTRHVQLKSVFVKGKAQLWEIHASLLRPEPHFADWLSPFHADHSGTGYGGAVVLQEVDVTDDRNLEIRYHVCDGFTLVALARDIVRKHGAPTINKTASSFIRDVQRKRSHEKIELKRSLFLEAKDPATLLALLGLHAGAHGNSTWADHLRRVAAEQHEGTQRSQTADLLLEDLKMLAKTRLIRGCGS